MKGAAKLLAVALALPMLFGSVGLTAGEPGGRVDGTLYATIVGETITFEIHLNEGVELGSTIKLSPKPMAFVLDEDNVTLRAGPVDVLLVLTQGGETTIMIPKEPAPGSNETAIQLVGSLEVPGTPNGTVIIGPLPFIRPNQDDPYGGGGPIVIDIRPNQDDPY
jgi:hypothetical protein